MIKLNKTMIDLYWAFISIAVSSLVQLLLRVVLGRDLGVSGLGIYTLIFTIYLFGMQFANFGIGSALTKYVAEYRDDLKKITEYTTSGILGSFIYGSAISVILFLSSDLVAVNIFHYPDMGYLLKVLAFCFPFIAVQKSVLGVLNGWQKITHYAIINIAQNTLVFLSSILLVIVLHLGINGAVLGLVLPTIVVGSLSLAYVKRSLFMPRKLLDGILIKLSGFGFYVTLANSVSLINSQVNVLLIGVFLNDTQVGYFAVAGILIQGMSLLPSAVQTIISPKISRLHGNEDYSGIRKIIKSTFMYTFIITVLLSISLILFGRYLIDIFFSDVFAPAYLPLVLLVIGQIAYAPLVSIGSALAYIGKVNVVFKIEIASMAFSVLLNILLIPTFGINGAAAATSISLILTTVLNLYVLNTFINDLDGRITASRRQTGDF
ncbi:putative polysaccharide biosynthesis protein [Methanocella paludicola SANAE]|uniref:Polysaccharide biosynthesis protein n=1 Tax=Methanocella paludicola (strain DSM 17711 / JCM 13418 / NBRC 101707 / SANAE) TaxID=304371 RepID=D1YWM7_METPS|nr:flippase [Methanocella paludicola]BAI60849.1 putative polysaccharide biosynthesis protein [Methanocella paludicola SANAE]